MMGKRVLCIGPCSDLKNNKFTGQSVMFDGVLNYFKQHGFLVGIVDISSIIGRNGKIYRVIDYIVIISILLFKLLFHHYDVCYITTSQTKRGFLRDDVIIRLCRLFIIPVIAHQYGANYHQLTDNLNEKGKKRLKAMLDYVKVILVEGEYMRNQFSFLPEYKNKVVVVPNGLPFEGKNVGKAKVLNSNEPFILFYLSNMIWSKGYFNVLEAVDFLVNRDGLNVNCVFAGQFMPSADDEKPGIASKVDFNKYVDEHNLRGYIKYFPGLYGNEKDRYFSKSNVFLLPTYYINEGQPVSIIEAMAYGCVPIVTKYRHIPMMVNENNGCFVEAKDSEAIASKVRYLIEHPDNYESKSKQCINDYQQNFIFKVFASKVMDCVNTVVS